LSLPGLEHRTIAGHAQGLKTMEVWQQTMAPGSATPVHRHACEEVIVILEGEGECTVEGERRPFGANTTLIIPKDAVHQLVNTGARNVLLIAALGMAPVRVRDASGERMELPWDAPERGT
jgi:mannose-6-phosphate isomerase-like protein (cupin superfamily)